MFILAETRWWHLKQVDDGVPVVWNWSKQHGLSERLTDIENFVLMRNRTCDWLRSCVIPKTAGRQRIVVERHSRTHGFMCRKAVPCLPSRLSP